MKNAKWFINLFRRFWQVVATRKGERVQDASDIVLTVVSKIKDAACRLYPKRCWPGINWRRVMMLAYLCELYYHRRTGGRCLLCTKWIKGLGFVHADEVEVAIYRSTTNNAQIELDQIAEETIKYVVEEFGNMSLQDLIHLVLLSPPAKAVEVGDEIVFVCKEGNHER